MKETTHVLALLLLAALVPGGRPSADLIHDGSFELGPPPASAWTELNNSVCERIGDFSGEWYVSAHHGTYDYWAGGYCVDPGSGLRFPVVSSVTQTVTVPPDSARLSFYYIAFRPDPDDIPPDGDRAYVAIDGEEVWTLAFIQANNTYPDWVGPIFVDLSTYSGQSVELTLGGVPVGDVTGNARFDYIEFVETPTPVETGTWGSLKSLFR